MVVTTAAVRMFLFSSVIISHRLRSVYKKTDYPLTGEHPEKSSRSDKWSKGNACSADGAFVFGGNNCTVDDTGAAGGKKGEEESRDAEERGENGAEFYVTHSESVTSIGKNSADERKDIEKDIDGTSGYETGDDTFPPYALSLCLREYHA